jgi:lipopolysaccharide biosynthesis protein
MKISRIRLSTLRVLVKCIPRNLMQKIPKDIREPIKDFIYPEPSHFLELNAQHLDRVLPHLTSPSFPPSWRPQIANWLARGETPEVCFVIHAYYLDLLDDLFLKLKAITFDFDIVITNSSSSILDEKQITEILRKSGLKDILVLNTVNRGRDILPLIHCVNAGILDSYNYFFKFHTKRSKWARGRQDIGNGGGGSGWRQSFYEDLIGDGTNSSIILEHLKRDIDLGIVTERNSLLGSNYWTGNLRRTQELATRLELEFIPDELLFPAGSMYACKGLVIQGLRALCLSDEDFEPELGQLDNTTAHAVERLVGLVSIAGGYKQCTTQFLLASKEKFPTCSKNDSKFVAFYLPQFHSDPKNDLFWGENFTEWNNVTRALPQYSTHFQPLLPTDLGFYNLELEETAIAQDNLAKKFGVSAFMYYYYNFGDSVALEKPLRNRLKRVDGLPFSILWANENWSRNWDGLEAETMIEQRYPDGWEFRFVDSISPFLSHPDFLRDKQNRPIFSIYRPSALPNAKISLRLIREHARNLGLGELHILLADTQSSFPEGDIANLNSICEGLHSFPPHGAVWDSHTPPNSKLSATFEGSIYAYNHENYIQRMEQDKTRYHFGVLTRFDNTPRRLNKAHIYYGSNPYSFRRNLLYSKRLTELNSQRDKLIFINAWNEWAEGAILEPSNRFGKTYLLALREINDAIVLT